MTRSQPLGNSRSNFPVAASQTTTCRWLIATMYLLSAVNAIKCAGTAERTLSRRAIAPSGKGSAACSGALTTTRRMIERIMMEWSALLVEALQSSASIAGRAGGGFAGGESREHAACFVRRSEFQGLDRPQ